MAHQSVEVKQLCVPILGHPGTGYETVLQSLRKLGYDAEPWDDLGSRFDPLLNSTWFYDPIYVWRKALQKSEDGRIRFLSMGGDNWYEIALLSWPVCFILDPLTKEEWAGRANFWRELNAPDLGKITREEKESYAQRVRVANNYLRRFATRPSVIHCDSRRSPDQIAHYVLEKVKFLKGCAEPQSARCAEPQSAFNVREDSHGE